MDAEGLKELFEPFGPVAVKRMFSGHGIYADGWCFALSLRGEIYLRTDEESAVAFAASGSTPFVYQRRDKTIKTNLWRLPLSAYDDEDELKRWSARALDVARRLGGEGRQGQSAQGKGCEGDKDRQSRASESIAQKRLRRPSSRQRRGRAVSINVPAHRQDIRRRR